MNELRKLPQIIHQCRTIGEIPTSYKVSLTYEEQLMWFCRFLEEEVIPVVNNNSQVVQELKTYVEEYFDNLDVQEEINNKLEAMAESGELEEIIAEYINSNALICFDTVAELKAATNLVNGSYARTFGYYNKGDKGANIYYISENSTNDIRSIELDSGLYAIATIESNELYANKFGIHADVQTDDTEILQDIIDYCNLNKLDLIIDGYIFTTDTIELKGVRIKGIGKIPELTATYNSHEYGNIGYDYLKNVNNGALITMQDFIQDKLKTGSGIVSQNANPIVNNDYQYGNIDLENITICGWLRTNNQEGLTTSNTTSLSYLWGNHKLKNVNITNCGSNGVHINSLETTTIENVHCDYNFGHGFYIEGINGTDTPFEYVTIKNSSFNGNKQNGFYAHNCYRKNVFFENCCAVRVGLYTELGITIPTTTANIYAGFKIDGKESAGANNTQILEFNNCYGENTNVLISLPLYQANFVNNKITIKNCTLYPTSNEEEYCIAYLSTYYTDYFNFYDNYINGTNQILFGTITHITPLICDEAFYGQYMTKLGNLSFHQNLNVSDLIYKKYGNMVSIGFTANATAEIPSNAILMSNFPKPIANLRQPIMINNTAYNASLWTNDQFKAPTTIPNGADVRFYVVYPVPMTQ